MSKVFVFGSINMDIVVFADRHPKVGEVVIGSDLKYFPGGKGANQAVASKKLGADATLIGMVGNDASGEELLSFLKDQKVKISVGKTKKAPTGIGLITVAKETGNNTIVAVFGANFKIKKEDIKVKLNKGDILVGQFEVPAHVTEYFFKQGRKVGTINIFNAAPVQSISNSFAKYIDILVVNETELEVISGKKVNANNSKSITDAVSTIKNKFKNIIVTLGENGAIAFTDNVVINIPGRKVKAVDTTGAGDCFIGALASALSRGSSMKDSISFANIAASISVTRYGAGPSIPTLQEVKYMM